MYVLYQLRSKWYFAHKHMHTLLRACVSLMRLICTLYNLEWDIILPNMTLHLLKVYYSVILIQAHIVALCVSIQLTRSKTLIHSATKQATVCMSESLNNSLNRFVQKHWFIQQWNRREAIAWYFYIFVAAKNTQIKCMNCKWLNINQL